MVVHNQIKNRINDPWKIDQGQSSLCGMAALYYAMAKKDSNAYEKLAKELFRTGEYRISNYIVKPHEKALSMYDVKPSDVTYKAMRMPEIDWIVLATTRSKESLNSHFVYNGFENSNIDMLKGVNWPEMLTRMCKEVGGFASVESHGLSFNAINNKKRPISGRVHDYFSHSDLEELQAIDKAHKWGRTILMMIDADMIDDKSSYNSLVDIGNDSHWVVYEGGLQLFDAKEKITTVLDNVYRLSFKIFTWGYNPVNQKDEFGEEANPKHKFIFEKQKISVESFKSNYYGYIEIF